MHEQCIEINTSQMNYCKSSSRPSGYTLCTNIDKSVANHESHIVYTQVIHVQSCLIWFVIRRFATNSGFWTNHQRTRTWFELICLWCVYLYTLFMHFGGFLVYFGSFSTQVGWITWVYTMRDSWFAPYLFRFLHSE